jgi:molybdenum cofactor sulfurtransferase
LLDIASAAAHSPIDLKEVDPDTLPTKAEKERQCVDYHYSIHSSHVYYGGGSVNAILPSCNFIIPKPQLSSFVNGTVHFQGIASLVYGFQELSRVGGMTAVSMHSRLLALELVRRFQNIRHENGNPGIRIYGAWNNISVMQAEREISNDNLPGPTVAFNVIRSDSSYVGYNEISKLASLNNPPIQLRTGCFCNVGACQEALSISDNAFKENYFVMGHVCGDHNDIISGKPTGAIRASFGKDNCWDDVDALAIFLQRLVINQKDYSYGSLMPSSELHSFSKCLPSYRERPWNIRELYVFPIKSCAPMRVKSWRLDITTGQLEFDREFALVDTNGAVMRLQSFPQMAKIRPSIDLQRKTLTVTAPGVEDLVLFLDDHACLELSHDVNVCGNNHHGKVFGSRISAAWFSSVLGIRCFLVRYVNNVITERNGDEKFAVESKASQEKSVNVKCRSFSNEAPLLLITQQAVNILNNTLKVQGQSLVSSLHFRPNLVLDIDDDCNERIVQSVNDISQSLIKQHPEDWWYRILINEGELEFTVVGQCSRCTMVDICPETGKKEYKALRVMADYCRSKGNINFGVFLRLHNSECLAIRKHFSVISEGDKVTPCMAR